MAETGLQAIPDTAALDLIRELVTTPCVSGNEAAVAELFAAWGRDRGLEVETNDFGVRMTTSQNAPGPLLLLASHLDTVPPAGDWTVDPYAGIERDGTLCALGAVDAKASLTAMAVAVARLQAEGGAARGRFSVLATFCEETADTTMPQALAALDHRPDAVIVGEPTLLQPCIAQRGLLILRGVWEGDQRHAGWVDQEAMADNAILKASRDLQRVAAMSLPEVHEQLGRTNVVPTKVHAGVAHNVTPASCEVTWDARTTPAIDHATVVDRLRGVIEEGRLEIISDRFHPTQTPEGSALLEAIRAVHPDGVPYASPTTSDWVWMRDLDVVKLGPGDSRQSHTADETLPLEQLYRGARLYQAIAEEFLS